MNSCNVGRSLELLFDLKNEGATCSINTVSSVLPVLLGQLHHDRLCSTMALFSSRTLLSARIIILAYVAYQLIVSPRSVIEYSGVLVLSSSMNLPLLMVNEKSPIYGVIGVVMFSLLLNDIGPLFDGNTAYFESTVFIRLSFFFALCIYCYLGTWVVLCNSLIFTYSFFEVWFGILTFSTLKEERYARAKTAVTEEAEYRQKYERGELPKEEEEEYEEKVKEEEYQKIMQEFKN